MQALAWSFGAMLAAKRPRLSYTGLPFDHITGSDCTRALAEAGEDLPCAAMVLYIKGDWAEVQHSLGLPSIASRYNPCPYCDCTSHDMHDRYRGMSSAARGWPFRLRDEAEYEASCREQEIWIAVASEDDRALIQANLAVARGKKFRGCHIASRIVVV